MNVSLSIPIARIATITRGKWLNRNPSAPDPDMISLDSRRIISPSRTLFIAIKTRQQDANLFIEALYKKGVRNFLTEAMDIEVSRFPLANIIGVTHAVSALQKMAVHQRNATRKDPFPVIGITGSNGKTIVKEWLNQLLENEFSISRSPKSFNSQIGVPLSVLAITSEHTLGLFEAGISLPGEMKKLEKIIKPTIGILTNIGNAHDEGFKTRTQKIREKLGLFQHAAYLVYDGDDLNLHREVRQFRQKNQQLRLFSWGKKASNALQVNEITRSATGTSIRVTSSDRKIKIFIPFSDEASVQNALHCLCVLLILHRTDASVLRRFRELEPVAMRLELRQGINHCNIINDSYSNDFYSLGMALDFLVQQKQHKVRTLILSDIPQSGIAPDKLYGLVASLIKQKGVDKFVGIGPNLFSSRHEFSGLRECTFFKTTETFLEGLFLSGFHDETILIKGARSFEFERISHVLEQKVHQTVLSINLSALVHNLKIYKKKLQPETKIMAMVKAFSYGSGSHEIASVLEYNKIDYLAVAYADEGVELRKAGISLPVMVMNTDISTFDSLINNQLEPELFSFELLQAFTSYLKRAKIENYPVHLKIDTGMHRLGFMEEEMDPLCSKLSGNRFLRVKTVFSHLAASEDPEEDSFTREQYTRFKKCCSLIEQCLDYSFDSHIDNTAGISRHPEFQMDMVRLGIGLYGIDSDEQTQRQLQNVSTLTTTISQIKRIKAGETVGYGRRGKVEKDSRIAIVGIGYADGYSRVLGNGIGRMRIKNKLVPVIGNVCMDMTMLDISGIRDIKEGDEVTVFGEFLPVQSVAQWAQTIPYEILTGISRRVKRIYFQE